MLQSQNPYVFPNRHLNLNKLNMTLTPTMEVLMIITNGVNLQMTYHFK